MGKGQDFERETCKELSRWWTDGERSDIFWRTAGSGARHTTRKKKGKATANSAGDVRYDDAEGKAFIDFFLVELKKGYNKDLDILSIVDSKNKNHTLLKWIKKAEKERIEAVRNEILIIIRRDRKQKCVVINSKFYGELLDYNGDFDSMLIFINTQHHQAGTVDSYVLIPYENFFEWIDRETIEDFI